VGLITAPIFKTAQNSAPSRRINTFPYANSAGQENVASRSEQTR
jgi:hypothetical protein